jgi:hypothetical protein
MSLNGKEDRRHAFTRLCEHYDGPGETQKWLALARSQIGEVQYKLKLRKLRNKTQGSVWVVRGLRSALHQQPKVNTLIKAIQC